MMIQRDRYLGLFQMMIEQLDSVRQRKSKFVCINDDLTEATPEMKDLIKNFYESFFPLPSQFEKHRSKEMEILIIYRDDYF